MNQTRNGLTAPHSQPVKKTYKQGRHFTVNQQKNAVYRSRCGIIRSGAEYTIKAADLPDREAFSCPEFMVLDVGRVYPQGWPHRFGGVFKPHAHSSDLNNQRLVFEVPKGIKAMKTITTGQTAPTQTPDHHALSFVKVEFKGPRKQRLTHWFNVLDESYCDGNVRGYRVAAELMAWLKDRPATFNTGWVVREIIAAAFAVLSEPCKTGQLDRRGAAVTFLESMASFLMFAAKHSNHQTHLEGKAQHSEDWAKQSAQMDVERNRETGRRLAAARAAKRAARMAESGVLA